MDPYTLPAVKKLNDLAADVITTLAAARQDPEQRAGAELSARILVDEINEELAKVEAVPVEQPVHPLFSA